MKKQLATFQAEWKKKTSPLCKVSLFLEHYVFLTSSYPEEALIFANAAIEFSKEINREDLLMKVSRIKGMILGDSGKEEEAKPILEACVQYCIQSSNLIDLALCYNDLGKMYVYRCHYEEAEKYYKLALATSQSANDETGVARAYNNLANAAFYRFDYQEMLRYLQQALPIAQKLNHIHLLSSILLNLGVGYFSFNNYAQAQSYYLQALRLAEETKNATYKLHVLINLGGVYENIGDNERSLQYYIQACELGERLGDKRLLAYSYNAIGAIHLNLKQFDSVLPHLSKALQIAEEVQNNALTTTVLLQIANYYKETQKLALCKENLSKAHLLAVEMKNIVSLCEIAMMQSEISFNEDEQDNAIEYLLEALELAQQLQKTNYIADCCNRLAELYEQRGDTTSALTYFKQYHEADAKYRRSEADLIIKKTNLEHDNQNLQEVNQHNELMKIIFQQAQQIAEIGSWYWAMDTSDLYITDEMKALLGLREERSQWSAREILRCLHPEDRPRVINLIKALRVDLKPFLAVARLRTPEGEDKVVEIHAGQALDNYKKALGFCGSIQDVTLKNSLISSMKESKLQMQSLFDALPDITFILSEEGVYEKVMIARSHPEYANSIALEGKSIQDLLPSNEAQEFLKVIKDTINHKQGQIHEYQFLSSKNIYRWYEGRTSLYIDPSTHKTKVIWVARDVTTDKENSKQLKRMNSQLEKMVQDRTRALLKEIEEKKQTEQQLRQQAAERDALNSILPAIIFYKDTNRRYIGGNDKFYQFIGRKFSKEDHLTDADVFPQSDLERISNDDAQILRGEVDTIHRTIHYPNFKGTSRWMSVSKTAYRNPEGEVQVIVGIAIDITTSKLQEEELRYLFTAIEQAGDIITILDTNKVIKYVNPAFEKTTGFCREEALGKTPFFIKSGKHGAEFYKHLWSTILHGETWRGKLINKRKDGVLYEEEAAISPIKDAEGNIVSFVKASRDVTKELIMQEQLRQAQKMEALGTLAGGIAHDFNNILGAVLGYAELISDDLDEESVAAKNMQQILSALDRAKDLVGQILSFSRSGVGERKVIRLQPIIQEVAKLIRASIPANIEINIEMQQEAAPIVADPSQIHQILMNLCANSFSAMTAKGGSLTISLEEINLEGDVLIENDMVGGNYVKLSVSDTGCGIPQDIIDRIFDPFFTTKEPGQGTGLGLSVVHGIVTSLGGKILLESIRNVGTTIHIYMHADRNGIVSPNDHEELMLAGKGNVLVVDDEATIRDILNQMLTRLGYSVTVAEQSKQALELLADKNNKFDILITDLTMPTMNGLELAKRALAKNSSLPIIMTSGYNELLDEKAIYKAGIKAILQKPIDRIKLAEILDQYINH